MMENLTLCHVLVALAAIDLVAAAFCAMTWMKYKDELRGTPLYARRRDARRLTIWLVLGAVVMLALAYLTPLGDIALTGA
jgi:hypothetical protein